MFNQITPIRPLHTEYRDVNNNRIKSEGKTKNNGESRNQWGNKKSRTAKNDKKNKPIARAGMDELLVIKLETDKTNLKIQNFQEDPDVMEMNRKFKKIPRE